ncbi:hypothetical protein [Antarctobacter jejuensis]
MNAHAQTIDDRKTRLWRTANLTTGAVLLAYCLLQVLLAMAGGAP